MKTKMLRFVMLIAMVFSALTPVTQAAAQVESASSKGVSPAGMLNADGTLDLSKGFNGTLNLSGYSVEMDPKRGSCARVTRASASKTALPNLACVGAGMALNVYYLPELP